MIVEPGKYQSMNKQQIANGGLSWLGNRQWWEVTREERYFCAELYCAVKEDISKFIAFLDSKYPGKINMDSVWQIGYEVCFYRDWAKIYPEKSQIVEAGSGQELSKKRTFDLALFSNSQAILFEAKAQQYFTDKQAKEFESDRELFRHCTGVAEVHTAAIISSKYTPQDKTTNYFSLNPLISWEKLACLFDSKSQIFRRADSIYRN